MILNGENMIKTTEILIQEYNSYSNPKMKIGRLVKEGKLIPIIKGLYETDSSIPGHYLAGIIYGPSYLSFEFALSWHNLIPEAVYTFTSASYSKKKNAQTMKGNQESVDTLSRSVYNDSAGRSDRLLIKRNCV